MKVAVASHIVLDSIKDREGRITQSLGGPACYCGLTAKQFGFEVILATKVGKKDFSPVNMNILRDYGITIKEYQMAESATTTKFELVLNNEYSRDLFLISKCAPLTLEDIQNIQTDCWLVSPVIDEVPANILAAIVKDGGKKKFVMLDPQGYLRSINATTPLSSSPSSRISLLDNLTLDLSGITAIKVDKEELAALTGGLEGLEGMQFLQSKGVKFVISTTDKAVHLLHDKMHYWVKVDISTSDYTGAGDILSGSVLLFVLKGEGSFMGSLFWRWCRTCSTRNKVNRIE